MTVCVRSNFGFSEIQTAQKTVMFDSTSDWMQELKRTKGNCNVTRINESYELSTK